MRKIEQLRHGLLVGRGEFVTVHLVRRNPTMVVHAGVPDLTAGQLAAVDAEVDVVMRIAVVHVDDAIADVHLEGESICGTDLARKTHVVPDEQRSFEAKVYAGTALRPSFRLEPQAVPGGNVCVPLAHLRLPPDLPDDAKLRYFAVDITNGYSRGPLRVFLYDLGTRGFRIAGIERPSDTSRP